MKFNFSKFGLLITTILFISCVSSNQENNNQNINKWKSSEITQTITDTIVFVTSNNRNEYIGKMLYPKTKKLDSLTFGIFIEKGTLSLSEVGDTLFAFLGNKLLSNKLVEILPEINKMTLNEFYPKYYNVIIDDDIPYFVNISNSKDNIVFIKERGKDVYYIENSMIRDTFISVFNGVKVGMEKEIVFDRLSFPDFYFKKGDFSLIICNVLTPTRVWYKDKLKDYGYTQAEKSFTTSLLKFKNNRLDYIIFNDDIGFYELENP
jgi:hypothetical protein